MKFCKILALFALPAALTISGCGGSSDENKDEPMPVTYQLSITAANTQEIQEQTEYSIRADISGSSSDSSTLAYQVSWSIKDAPSGFTMPLTGGELNSENQSIIQFTTPDVDLDTNITLSVTASIGGTSETTSKDIAITILANQEIVISGAVVDDPIPNATVTITVGEREFSTQADSQGTYQVPVEFPEPELIALMTATGAEGQENVLFKSYVGSGEALVQQAGEDAVLDRSENFNVNITNVTTAAFALIHESLGDEETIDSQEKLTQAVEALDDDKVLEVAAIIKVIVDNEDIDLPEGFDNVLELVTDETATTNFIEEVTLTHPDIIDDTKDEIKTDGNLTPTDVETGTLIGSDGSVTLVDVDGTSTETEVVLAAPFSIADAPGVYDMELHYTENGVSESENVVVTVTAGGSGTIDFGLDEDGQPDINDISWVISPEGYLAFTEYSTDGSEEWYFIIVNITDDRGNAVIDILTPEGQEDAADFTLIGYFTKRTEAENEATDIIDENGNVTLKDDDGTTSSYAVTLGTKFTSANVVGVYDFYYDFGNLISEKIILTINANNSGTIEFSPDDISSISWTVGADGYLRFTEVGEFGNQWFWVLVPIEDDNFNVLIDVSTPKKQDDFTDVTGLGNLNLQ